MLLLFLFSVTSALDPNPTDINKVCYKCNVYSAAGKMKCENPGVCYSNFCYSYVTSNGITMFLSGCAEDVTDFPIKSISVGLHCQSSGGVALCVCATGKEGCNYPEKSENSAEKLKKILWLDSDTDKLDNISTKVTGFSLEYAKQRVEHLMQDGLDKVPMHFNISRVNSTPCNYVISVLSSLIVLSL